MIKKNNFFNIIIFMIAAYALYMKMPSILTNFKSQDKKSSDFNVKLINGENFNLHSQSKKIVIVFWATWCGPCEIELKRINKMVIDKKIQVSDVLAISSFEEESIVKQKVKKENYLFNIGLDTNGNVFKLFNVSATPTILFIDENKIINWMSAGLSPSLEYRINSFI